MEKQDYTSYSYIGMGVPSDPPNVYSLVTRYLPLQIAYWYMAVILFIAEGENDMCHYIRKRKVMYDVEFNKAKEKVEQERTQHHGQVQWRLQKLKNAYDTPTDFFDHHRDHSRSPSGVRRRQG